MSKLLFIGNIEDGTVNTVRLRRDGNQECGEKSEKVRKGSIEKTPPPKPDKVRI